eukprot:g19477.t1
MTAPATPRTRLMVPKHEKRFVFRIALVYAAVAALLQVGDPPGTTSSRRGGRQSEAHLRGEGAAAKLLGDERSENDKRELLRNGNYAELKITKLNPSTEANHIHNLLGVVSKYRAARGPTPAGEGFERTYSCFRELPHPGARVTLFRDHWATSVSDEQGSSAKELSRSDFDFERKWPDTLKRLYCPGFAEVGGDQTGSALASETRECFLASAEPPIVATRREEHEEQEQDPVDVGKSKDLQTAKSALSQMVLGALFVFHGTTVGKKEIIAATWESVRWGLQKIKADVLGIKVLHLGSVDNEGERGGCFCGGKVITEARRGPV